MVLLTTPWASGDLALIDGAHELEIAVRRPDGTLRSWTPIWVVRVDAEVYVRSWYRRDTGWFGHAVSDRAAAIRVPGLSAEVTVTDLGNGEDVRDRVDAAYRAKYGEHGAASMITPEAAATTLRLDPAR